MLVHSFSDTELLLRSRPEHYEVISIGREVPRRSLCRCQLVLDFDDLSLAPDPKGGARPDERAPQAKHITQALAFARKADDERLLVHCKAGLSRSPAIAWCILLDRFHDPSAASIAIFRLQPRAIPNPILIHQGLRLLTGSTKEFTAIRTEMRRLSCHRFKHMLI